MAQPAQQRLPHEAPPLPPLLQQPDVLDDEVDVDDYLRIKEVSRLVERKRRHREPDFTTEVVLQQRQYKQVAKERLPGMVGAPAWAQELRNLVLGQRQELENLVLGQRQELENLVLGMEQRLSERIELYTSPVRMENMVGLINERLRTQQPTVVRFPEGEFEQLPRRHQPAQGPIPYPIPLERFRILTVRELDHLLHHCRVPVPEGAHRDQKFALLSEFVGLRF